jgi:hypothetical protein
MSVKKRDASFYQDGTPLVEDELDFYHATNEGLISSILVKGVCASIPSHGKEGLWVFSLLCPEAYDWGMSPLQYFGGHVLHLKIPARLQADDGSYILMQNDRIRGASTTTGHLRWVLNGKHLSPYLRCRLVGIYVRIPSADYMHWIKTFKQSIRNCIPWCHQLTFDPQSQASAQKHLPPQTSLKIFCTGDQKCEGDRVLHCLANAFPRAPLESVMCRGTGNECLLYCVQEMKRLDTANSLSHILPDGSPITEPHREQSKLKSQLLMCVERRLVYASAVSLDKAFSADGADCILQSSSDIFAGVRAMSADLAQVLYPLLQTRIAAPHKLWGM